VLTNLTIHLFSKTDAVSPAGGCANIPVQVTIARSIGIKALQQLRVRTKAAGRNDRRRGTHPIVANDNAADTAVFDQQAFYARSEHSVDGLARQEALDTSYNPGTVTCRAMASPHLVDAGCIQVVGAKADAYLAQPFESLRRLLAKGADECRLEFVLVERHVILIHGRRTVVGDLCFPLQRGAGSVENAT
jgi:hypothetical protein